MQRLVQHPRALMTRPPQQLAREICDSRFAALLVPFGPSGGLARSEEVSTWLECVLHRAPGELARWRAARQVICFEWQHTVWLPRFQFAQAEMLPDPAVCVLLAQLRESLDEAEAALWCGEPNPLLMGQAPVALLQRQPLAVFAAAVSRTDPGSPPPGQRPAATTGPAPGARAAPCDPQPPT